MRLKTIRWKAPIDHDDTEIAIRILSHSGAWAERRLYFDAERADPVLVWHIRWPS